MLQIIENKSSFFKDFFLFELIIHGICEAGVSLDGNSYNIESSKHIFINSVVLYSLNK